MVDGATTTYTYDVADQLISESGPWGSRTYSYDANGNRTYGAGASYTYGPGDRLLSRGNETFTYDGLGRMKTRTLGGAVTTYNWDYDSRLVSVVQGSTTVQSNVYLGSGARVRQTEGGTSRNFRREGVGVTDPITYDGVAHITPGLARTEGGVNTSVFGGIKSQDLQVSGSAVASRRYDAFGVPISSSGTWKGASAHGGFYGYQENPTTGLQLLGHRYYDPTLGRFISKDPIGSGSNWYAYCNNNPLNAADPSGHVLETIFDVAFLAYDIYQFAQDPTPENALNVAWSAASVAVPGMPGSYVGKTAKAVSNSAATAAASASAGVKISTSNKAQRALAKDGRGVKSGLEHAHHIVAKASRFARDARDKLKALGIDLDDPINLTPMPKDIHRKMHKKEYYEYINDRARRWKTKQDAYDDLVRLREDIMKLGP